MNSKVYVALISTVGAVIIAVITSVSTVAAVGTDYGPGADVLSRSEVSAMIESEGPYVQDRRYLLAGIERIERELAALRRAVQTP